MRQENLPPGTITRVIRASHAPHPLAVPYPAIKPLTRVPDNRGSRKAPTTLLPDRDMPPARRQGLVPHRFPSCWTKLAALGWRQAACSGRWASCTDFPLSGHPIQQLCSSRGRAWAGLCAFSSTFFVAQCDAFRRCNLMPAESSRYHVACLEVAGGEVPTVLRTKGSAAAGQIAPDLAHAMHERASPRTAAMYKYAG